MSYKHDDAVTQFGTRLPACKVLVALTMAETTRAKSTSPPPLRETRRKADWAHPFLITDGRRRPRPSPVVSYPTVCSGRPWCEPCNFHMASTLRRYAR